MTTQIDVVGIDEAQFFDDGIIEVVQELADRGIRVIIAGLDMDFRRQPFGPMAQLCAIADSVDKIHAICIECGRLANYSYRLNSSSTNQVLLGKTKEYRPLCRDTAISNINSTKGIEMTKKLKFASITGILVLSLSSCIISFNRTASCKQLAHIKTANNISPTLGGKLYTSAWIQRSAEYKALCLQAYNIAWLHLDNALKSPRPQGAKPWAIVTDIDETILDNTPNSVHQAQKGEDYTDISWDNWCDKADAIPLEGAKQFFDKADKSGVTIFYISNRIEKNRTGTLKNLRSLGFPQVEDSQLLLKSNTSDKTERRSHVLQQYEILMLLGDNLGDFDHVFDSSDELERIAGLKVYEREFGHRFIVFPNPNYGTWEKAMNQGYPSLQERDSTLLYTLLKTY